jgi:hypothetical protein
MIRKCQKLSLIYSNIVDLLELNERLRNHLDLPIGVFQYNNQGSGLFLYSGSGSFSLVFCEI